jgi:soluble lytic murein transglycosylase-like protein
MKPPQLSTIEDQIKMGAKVLRSYYKRFGSREAALHAFNVGPKNHIKSAKQPNKGNPRYVPKVDAEERLYAELER